MVAEIRDLDFSGTWGTPTRKRKVEQKPAGEHTHKMWAEGEHEGCEYQSCEHFHVHVKAEDRLKAGASRATPPA